MITALVILLILGGFLRLFHFPHLELSHDELSAWWRLRFPDFHSLLYKGIAVDAHPPLVQVFLYYWTHIFGDSTFSLRFPFLISSLICLPLSFKIGKRLFGAATGLWLLAFIATTQLAIVFAPIARPYGSGLLLALLLVDSWITTVVDGNKKWGPTWLLALLLALNAYNHYFSMMFAGLVWLSGWLYYKRISPGKYLLSGILAAVFFLPYFPIFLQQLGYGGIGGNSGWLAPPTPAFFAHFVRYLFNDMGMAWIFLWLVIVYAFLRKKRQFKLRIIFISWCLLSFLVGYFYSVDVNPVIQFSCLLFSVPFLFLGLLGELPETRFAMGSSVFFAALLTAGLFIQRKHYKVIAHQPVATISQLIQQEADSTGSVWAVTGQNPNYLKYYNPLEKPAVNFWSPDTSWNGSDLGQFSAAVRDQESTSLVISGNTDWLASALNYYPVITKRKMGYTFDAFVLRKKGKSVVKENVLQTFAHSPDTTSQEFENICQIRIDSIKDLQLPDYLGINVPYFAKGNLIVVFDFYVDGKRFHWSAVGSRKDLCGICDTGNLTHMVRLWDVFSKDPEIMKKAILKIYLWNPDKKTYSWSHARLYSIKGNPYEYGLSSWYPVEN